MKSDCKYMFLKLAKMVESDIRRFAGGPGPLGRKRSQEQCQCRAGNVWMASPSSPSNSLNEESSLQSAVSHGVSLIYSVLIVLLTVLAHMGL